MRVLYAVDNFPILSESYIRTEMEFVRAQGVEVAVASEKRPDVSYPVDVSVTYGEVEATVKRWKPDVIHVHWSNIVYRVASLGVPVTVRGHSFEFDPDVTDRHCGNVNIRRIFLFPHQVALCRPSPKLTPMTSAYSTARYSAGETKEAMVYRVGAGLVGKDLDGFIYVAARFKEMYPETACRFVLAVTTPDSIYAASLKNLNGMMKKPVELLLNISHEQSADFMKRASIYLRSHDPSAHLYGMPISIAEALASGCTVIVRAGNHAKSYVGDAGYFYEPYASAALLIRQLLSDKPNQASLERAKLFRDDVVLPPLVDAWRQVKP